MAVTAAVGGVVVAGAGVAASARESQIASDQASSAAKAHRADLEREKDRLANENQHPNNTASDLARANLLAQQAGGSLLSDPVADARAGRQIGTAPATGKSLLGS